MRSNNQPTDEFTTAEGFGGRWVDVLPSVESEMTPWIVGVWDDFEALASYVRGFVGGMSVSRWTLVVDVLVKADLRLVRSL